MDILGNQAFADIIFRVSVLLFSIVIHEVSHGATAYALGDSTAKDAGRLTLNPFPHLDFVGSVLMPLFVGIGWAKPVPYNPHNLRNRRWGPLLVGIAGPLSNIAVAAFFGIFIKYRDSLAFSFFDSSFFVFAEGIVFLNLMLAVFNLVPIPPLDGSKVLFAFLPRNFVAFEIFMEQYGVFILLILFFVFQPIFVSFLIPAVSLLFGILTGL